MGFGRRIRDKLDHRWANPRMHDYLDDDLSPGERLRLLRHAELCPECGPMLRSFVVLLFELRELRRRQQPETVAPAVIERIRREPLGGNT